MLKRKKRSSVLAGKYFDLYERKISVMAANITKV
jgi:hypothetical protein